MDMNKYQNSAVKTAIYPEEYKIMYPALGLVGEAGEVANKVKKVFRDGVDNMPKDWRENIASEIGDVMWYCAALAADLGFDLDSIANENLEKLSARKTENKIKGSGDKR